MNPRSERGFFLPETRPLILSGKLNQNRLVQGTDGRLYVERTPKSRTRILEDLYREYRGVGFLASGGSYDIRTPEEQVAFMQECKEKGLSVVSVARFDDGETIILPFVKGLPYDNFLMRGSSKTHKIIQEYLESITKAHQKGIVYGDRWGPNTIVDEGGITHIDFDIRLVGATAAEFELAQALYYSIYFSSNKEVTLQACVDFLNSSCPQIYDPRTVSEFLRGHVAYFGNRQYGKIKEEIYKLVA